MTQAPTALQLASDKINLRSELAAMRAERDAAIARAEKAEAALQWQPIETAPMDGEMILGAWQCLNDTWDMNAMQFHDGIWWDYYCEGYHDPTHWMHLPPSPETP